MAKNVPDKLANFKCYLNGTELLGVVDLELPSLDPMTSEVSGAGIMGSYETPVPGHFGSTTITINFRTPTRESRMLFMPGAHHMEFRAAVQTYNSGAGTIGYSGYQVSVKAAMKSPSLGSMKVAEAMENSFEMEVTYLKVTHEGIEVLMVDKANFIYRVNGIDQVKEIRDLV